MSSSSLGCQPRAESARGAEPMYGYYTNSSNRRCSLAAANRRLTMHVVHRLRVVEKRVRILAGVHIGRDDR
jgi:hypothetical protein